MRGVFRGPEKTTLSLLKNVTFSLGVVGAKANLDNFTKYDLFLRRPLAAVVRLCQTPTRRTRLCSSACLESKQ